MKIAANCEYKETEKCLNQGLEWQLENDFAKAKLEMVKTIIRDIGSKKCVEAISTLVKYLKITNDNGLRNAITLALSDIGEESTIETIIDIINDPKTRGARGTLIYALQGFQYEKYFEDLIEFIKDDGYEARAMTIMLLKNKVSNAFWRRNRDF